MAEHTGARLVWQSGLRFSATPDSGHAVVVDSPSRPGHAGPSPVELLMIGVGGCTAMDVVSILEKMRQPLSALEVEVSGERAERHPKYVTAVSITYRVRGHGVEREKVERAVELSHSTYCSALSTLRPDCRVTTTIEIEES